MAEASSAVGAAGAGAVGAAGTTGSGVLLSMLCGVCDVGAVFAPSASAEVPGAESFFMEAVTHARAALACMAGCFSEMESARPKSMASADVNHVSAFIAARIAVEVLPVFFS